MEKRKTGENDKIIKWIKKNPDVYEDWSNHWSNLEAYEDAYLFDYRDKKMNVFVQIICTENRSYMVRLIPVEYFTHIYDNPIRIKPYECIIIHNTKTLYDQSIMSSDVSYFNNGRLLYFFTKVNNNTIICKQFDCASRNLISLNISHDPDIHDQIVIGSRMVYMPSFNKAWIVCVKNDSTGIDVYEFDIKDKKFKYLASNDIGRNVIVESITAVNNMIYIYCTHDNSRYIYEFGYDEFQDSWQWNVLNDIEFHNDIGTTSASIFTKDEELCCTAVHNINDLSVYEYNNEEDDWEVVKNIQNLNLPPARIVSIYENDLIYIFGNIPTSFQPKIVPCIQDNEELRYPFRDNPYCSTVMVIDPETEQKPTHIKIGKYDINNEMLIDVFVISI